MGFQWVFISVRIGFQLYWDFIALGVLICCGLGSLGGRISDVSCYNLLGVNGFFGFNG